jgi:tRNA pseudouridine38-40 synthase
MTQRYAIELAYNGTDFFGWQRQPRQISVQEVVEQALSRVHSNLPVSVVGCGRTDTGVHAKQYFLHVDLPLHPDPEQLKFKLNKLLPESVAIADIRAVTADFHARFDATARTYRYFLHQQKDPFQNGASLYFPNQLDVTAMNAAAKLLLGTQDFTSLSKLHTDVKTNICTVTTAHWVQTSPTTLYFEITADRFLRNMVRATVGTLLEVGIQRIAIEQLPEILAAKDRSEAKVSVKAHGLFLWEIVYPQDKK